VPPAFFIKSLLVIPATTFSSPAQVDLVVYSPSSKVMRWNPPTFWLSTIVVPVYETSSSVAIALWSTASSCPVVECKSLSRTVVNGASASVEVALRSTSTAITVWVPIFMDPVVVVDGLYQSRLIVVGVIGWLCLALLLAGMRDRVRLVAPMDNDNADDGNFDGNDADDGNFDGNDAGNFDGNADELLPDPPAEPELPPEPIDGNNDDGNFPNVKQS
jgi:hypothetical protein